MQFEIGYSETVGSLIKRPDEGTAAAVVDIRTGTQRIVEKSGAHVAELGADASGAVRFRGTVSGDSDGYVRDRIGYAVRPKGSR